MQHIKAKRKARKALKQESKIDESTRELSLSLNRGEGIIRSQYDRDFRRFGDSFASGDRGCVVESLLFLAYLSIEEARDALKDIIIHLQQQVISNLKIHWQQDTFVDYTALQDVSDSSQDQCILILMRLQQRIVRSGPIKNLAPDPFNTSDAYIRRGLPPLPSANSFQQASQNPYALPPTGHIESPIPSSSGQSERGFVITSPTSGQHIGPLTPPRSPYPQQTWPFAQSPPSQVSAAQQSTSPQPPRQSNLYPSAASMPLAQSASSHFALPQSHSAQNQSAENHSPVNGSPDSVSKASDMLPLPEINQASAPQVVSVQPDQTLLAQYAVSQQTQPYAQQYALDQPQTQYSLAQTPDLLNTQTINPNNYLPAAHLVRAVHQRTGPNGFIGRDSPEIGNNSSNSQYKPKATTTAKAGFFGRLKKNKVDRAPEVPENPLVDQYRSKTLEDERRRTAQASSIIGSSATSRSSYGESSIDHPAFNPWQEEDQINNSTESADTSESKSISPIPQSLERATSSICSLVRPPTHQSDYSNHCYSPKEVVSFNAPIQFINPKDLLPNESNKFAGFCKGAWRQQIGDRKKAMEERVRPGGIYNAAKFLRCKTCKFEGLLVPANKKQHGLDMRVTSLVGIHFRWEFLFKSHVHAKDVVSDPTKGVFGCMFCCAEGKGTPTFEGVTAFMEHLVEHRSRLPTGEVLYRMNCLVGRQAHMEEDFDINIISMDGAAF